MDSYYDHHRYEIDVVQMEKAKAMRRYRSFQKVTNAVRTLEIFVAIMLVSWTVSWSSAYFPAAVKISGEFLRRAFSLICSPHFVFLIGNVIVVTLFAKSGETAAADTTVTAPTGDDVSGEEIVVGTEKVEVKCEIETVTEKEAAVVAVAVAEGRVKEEEVEKESDQRVYRRTRSAVERVVSEKRELRRSTTETRRKVVDEKPVARLRSRMFDEDDLSGDDFRRKVEEFIEKQQRALREESKAIVLSSC